MDLVTEAHVDSLYHYMNDDIYHLTTHLSEGEVTNPFIFNCQRSIDLSEIQNDPFTPRSFYSESIPEEQRFFLHFGYFPQSGRAGMNTCCLNEHENWNAGTAVQDYLPTADMATVGNASVLQDLSKPTIKLAQYRNHASNVCMCELWSMDQNAEGYDTSVAPNLAQAAPNVIPGASSEPGPSYSNPVLTFPPASYPESNILAEGGIKVSNEARGNPADSKEVSVHPKRDKTNNSKRSQCDSICAAEDDQITWISYTPLVEYTFVPVPVPAEYRVEFAAVETVSTAAYLCSKMQRRTRRHGRS
ncbi:hypothetical protein BDZ91DRAFT_797819 [Kalaharituber pfeilii]|nr:hypothetical protein BDZ91DRAFT_797819 [Kalaharituber pfeilii]